MTGGRTSTALKGRRHHTQPQPASPRAARETRTRRLSIYRRGLRLLPSLPLFPSSLCVCSSPRPPVALPADPPLLILPGCTLVMLHECCSFPWKASSQ